MNQPPAKNRLNAWGRGFLALVLLTLIAGFIGGFLPFSYPGLPQVVRQAASTAGFDSCAVEHVTMTPFIGLIAVDLSAKKRSGANHDLIVAASRMKIDYRPVEILLSWNHLQHDLQSMAATFDQRFSVDKIRAVIRASDSLIFPYIWRASLHGAHIEQRTVDTRLPDWLLDNCYLSFETAKKGPLRIQSEIQAQSMTLGPVRLQDVGAEIDIQDEMLYLKKFAGKFNDGKFRGFMDISLDKRTLTTGSFFAKNIDLAEVSRLSGAKNEIVDGQADITLHLKQSALCLPCVRGNGSFIIRELNLNNIPLLNAIAQTIMLPALNELKFKQVTGDIDISSGEIHCDNIKARGDEMDINAVGWIEPTGYFSFKIEGSLSPSVRPKVDPLVWESLFDGEKGRKAFRCTVSGTAANPHVAIDREHTQRAMRSVLKSISSEIRSILGK
jgi:hypothetical protein